PGRRGNAVPHSDGDVLGGDRGRAPVAAAERRRGEPTPARPGRGTWAPPVARGRRRGGRTHWSARAPAPLPLRRPPVHRGRGRLRRRTPPRRGPGPRGRPPRQVPRLPERGGGPARGTAHTARFGPYTDAPRPEGAPPL